MRDPNRFYFSTGVGMLLTITILSSSGCSFSRSSQRVTVPPPLVDATPARTGVAQDGKMEYVWEEPIVDVVDVPPGLDPEGNYYRPAHRSVREVRQGKYQYLQGDEAE